MSRTILTLGHSTLELTAFLELLRIHKIELLADVRRFPGSRRHPHFGSEPLARELEKHARRYLHLPELGGRRTVTRNSPNDAWRNRGFRAYADHMATAEFQHGVERLIAASAEARVALMCAEAVPWRCHRNLLSDELVRRGLRVEHVLGPGSRKLHEIHALAVDCGGHLVYRADESGQEHQTLLFESK